MNNGRLIRYGKPHLTFYYIAGILNRKDYTDNILVSIRWH